MNVDWNNIKQQVVELATEILGKYETQVLSDFNDFKKSVEADIEEWVTAYAAGDLKKDELEDLVLGEKDLLTLHALKQKGLGKVALDQFTAGVFSILTKAVTSLI